MRDEVRAPASGALLGTVAAASTSPRPPRGPGRAAAVVAGADRLAGALHPPHGGRDARRARRPRAAARGRDRLAEEPHRARPSCCPRCEGLHALAADGPRALADRRLAPRDRAADRPQHAARAVAGGRDRAARAVRVAVGRARAGGRRGAAGRQRRDPRRGRAARRPAPAPDLPARRPPGRAADHAPCRPGRRSRTSAAACTTCSRPRGSGRSLVLEGAPKDQLVEAALWAAFAGSGRHPAAAGPARDGRGRGPGPRRGAARRRGAPEGRRPARRGHRHRPERARRLRRAGDPRRPLARRPALHRARRA